MLVVPNGLQPALVVVGVVHQFLLVHPYVAVEDTCLLSCLLKAFEELDGVIEPLPAKMRFVRKQQWKCHRLP
eukprot:9508147-Prorocentrum_lima.AAC.1